MNDQPAAPDTTAARRRRTLTRNQLQAMIDEATVDCYNDSEATTGFYTMLEDHLATPFRTTVLDIQVTVVGVNLTDDDCILAVCQRGTARQRIPILDLPLPNTPPDGAEWIQAYRHWHHP